MKKLALFLATEKGFSVLQKLCASKYRENIGCVVSFHEIAVQKDWCDDLKSLCERNGIDFCLWKDAKKDLRAFVAERGVTSVIAISWRYLLPLSLNDGLEDDIIVFHDSLLPKYRGFAPVVTALLCGDSVVGATALFATDSVDAGDIILQKSLAVKQEEYIQDIVTRMSDLYASMALEIVEKIAAGSLSATPQDESLATFSVWRDDGDYEIDWTKDARDIYNQVRATGYPYKGAFTTVNGQIVRVLSASVVDDVKFALRDCGKIWKLEDGKPSVICGTGMLRIDSAVLEDNEPYDFTKLRVRLGR